MIYIYLDIDGVMNNVTSGEYSDRLQCDHDRMTQKFARSDVSGNVYHALHNMSVHNVNNLRLSLLCLKDYQPEIVVSSSWRNTMNDKQLTELIRCMSLGIPFHSRTPTAPDSNSSNFYEKRSWEIHKHVKDNGFKHEQIAILDDARILDLGDPLFPRFLKTDGMIGFSPHDSQDLVRLFKPDWRVKQC